MSSALSAESRILDAAEQLFKSQGYHAVLLADIATSARVPLPALQTHYHDKKDILNALLDRSSPREEIRSVLTQISYDTPEDMVRNMIRQLLSVFDQHSGFMDLMIIDVQINDGNYMSALFSELAGSAASFINRLANLPGTRPISAVMLGRALASILIGFVVTQHLAPRPAKFAMRIFPEKAWVEGVADILLYGILETE